jgi:hypothetical protein
MVKNCQRVPLTKINLFLGVSIYFLIKKHTEDNDFVP